MTVFNALIRSLTTLLHRHFLWLLLSCYAAAIVAPGLGIWIRSVCFGEISVFQQSTPLTLPMLMLALLLLNAGLEVRFTRLKGLPRVWMVLVTGIVANLMVPLVFIFAMMPILSLWLEREALQNILLGLALIASMPIAATSTAWSQKVNGNLALSLGLVVLSTLLSPLTTPMLLEIVSQLATGDYAEEVRGLAVRETTIFLLICVVGPSFLGIFLNWAIGHSRLDLARPRLKLLNWVNLLLLIYVNASISLPDAVAYPDVNFLLTAFGIAVVLCVLAFGSGAAVSRLLKTDPAQRAALMFGLGMNNNGAGLVLASVVLADYSQVMLPIIAYNLVQQLVAGMVASHFVRRSGAVTTDLQQGNAIAKVTALIAAQKCSNRREKQAAVTERRR